MNPDSFKGATDDEDFVHPQEEGDKTAEDGGEAATAQAPDNVETGTQPLPPSTQTVIFSTWPKSSVREMRSKVSAMMKHVRCQIDAPISE